MSMELDIVVEIPKGSRNKYEMDHRLGRIRLDRMLFTSTQYPSEYGYFPGTLGPDGRPLDALVLLEEPTFPGCLVFVRPVGVFWLVDEDGPDPKILTVPARDPRFLPLQDLDDVPPFQLAEIAHFFDIYKQIEPGRCTEVRGWQDRKAAEAEIEASLGRAGKSGGTTGI